ncbi:hypothetical protein L227DRAFT_175470 [Lentinus tigrinus ALCF2SS1-6]|uniref:Uncharacterized protein n=1 Tax=Lentinus tigrinus ALCF2SS1-6 TaxID=1328759 RepID=A0A5C2S6B8_9APHY|nr:hypothetical protein L227DRAFT_175470 [Lentinus tigrinus ALCF2SS1-6]
MCPGRGKTPFPLSSPFSLLSSVFCGEPWRSVGHGACRPIPASDDLGSCVRAAVGWRISRSNGIGIVSRTRRRGADPERDLPVESGQVHAHSTRLDLDARSYPLQEKHQKLEPRARTRIRCQFRVADRVCIGG